MNFLRIINLKEGMEDGERTNQPTTRIVSIERHVNEGAWANTWKGEGVKAPFTSLSWQEWSERWMESLHNRIGPRLICPIWILRDETTNLAVSTINLAGLRAGNKTALVTAGKNEFEAG